MGPGPAGGGHHAEPGPGRSAGQRVHEALRRTHMRTQGLSSPIRVFGIEVARSGRLGKIHTAYAQFAP